MESTASLKEKHHRIIGWALLSGLLFLRLPFVAVIGSLTNPNWLDPSFQIGTYLLTSCLIWWERDRLLDFNIDRLALYIIILFKPIETIILAIWKINESPLAFPNIPSLSIWIISLGLIIALWIGHAHLPKLSISSFGWFGIGILVGFIIILIMTYPTTLEISKDQFTNNQTILFLFTSAPIKIFYQLGYASVTEEPLFRAFLWGYLYKAGWKTVWIWLFQAGIFMLGHIYFLSKAPISFWFIVPLGGLIFGGLVWRSKTISSSLAAHAITDALTMTMVYIYYFFI